LIPLILWHQMTESVLYIDLNLLHISFQYLKSVTHRLKPVSHPSVHMLELLTPLSVHGLQLLCNLGSAPRTASLGVPNCEEEATEGATGAGGDWLIRFLEPLELGIGLHDCLLPKCSIRNILRLIGRNVR